MEIYLIGTDHWDLNGEERLEGKLSEIAPDFIFVEGSEEIDKGFVRSYSLFKRELEKIVYYKDLRDIVLKSCRIVGNEFRAVRKYSLDNSIKFEYFNDLDLKPYLNNERKKAKKEAELFRVMKYNQAIFTIKSNQMNTDKRWKRVKKYENKEAEYRLSNDLIFQSRGDGIGKRDKIMEFKIRNKAEEGDVNRLVCVNGFVHVLNDSENRTLYSKIKDLNPKRAFLYE